MEWTKEKTLKLIELLQLNANLWNSSMSDTRRDKQKRREELRAISEILDISVSDTTKKIQHLRTQYNREATKQAKAYAEVPTFKYVSNWYAYEYLHFMKDSNKPYKLFHSEENAEVNTPIKCTRDEYSVFGEYIANELRSLKGEKNLLVAKKKIQDVIFEVKMGMIAEPRDQGPTCTVYTHTSQSQNATTIHSGKLLASPVMSTIANIDQLNSSHTPPTSGISEIIINGACHYTNFKVDTQ